MNCEDCIHVGQLRYIRGAGSEVNIFSGWWCAIRNGFGRVSPSCDVKKTKRKVKKTKRKV